MTIFIDVDGTLVFHDAPDPGNVANAVGDPIVNIGLVKQIKEWHTEGKIMVVWSARGKNVAEWAIKFAKIEPYISFACGKPSIFVDDHYRWLDRIQKIDPNSYT